MVARLLNALVFALLLVQANAAHAVIEAVEFDDPALEQRYQSLIKELRCLVCQNQNIADSDAELATDLRRRTQELLLAGASDAEILDYMSDRYGEFVLYRPRFGGSNMILWFGPPTLLLLVLMVAVLRVRRQREAAAISTPATSSTEAERARIRRLLNTDHTE